MNSVHVIFLLYFKGLLYLGHFYTKGTEYVVMREINEIEVFNTKTLAPGHPTTSRIMAVLPLIPSRSDGEIWGYWGYWGGFPAAIV